MLAYDIKSISEIVPEALPLIKKADLEQDFPIDTKDSYIASRLRVEYLTKVANQVVDYNVITELSRLSSVYNVEEQLTPLMEKIAGYSQEKFTGDYNSKEELNTLFTQFIDYTSGIPNFEKAAEVAEKLYNNYDEKHIPDTAYKYACNGFLNKKAAVSGMIARYQASKDPLFIKMARLLQDSDETKLKKEDLVKLASVVSTLEEKSDIVGLGFNFYEEAIVKSAASVLEISIAGTKVPYETIAKLGKDRIASVIGSDVANELKNDPVNDKYVLESLPLDLQRIILSLVKSV